MDNTSLSLLRMENSFRVSRWFLPIPLSYSHSVSPSYSHSPLTLPSLSLSVKELCLCWLLVSVCELSLYWVFSESRLSPQKKSLHTCTGTQSLLGSQDRFCLSIFFFFLLNSEMQLIQRRAWENRSVPPFQRAGAYFRSCRELFVSNFNVPLVQCRAWENLIVPLFGGAQVHFRAQKEVIHQI
jgi:hypothetical protein